MAPTDEIKMTPRDQELILAAFKSMKIPPVIDYAELAKHASFKNPKVAATMWSTLKKKFSIGVVSGDNGAAASSTSAPKTPKTPKTNKGTKTPQTGSKRKAAGGENADESPLKRKKHNARDALALVQDDEEDEELKVKLEGATTFVDDDVDDGL
ncbi:hypothetical protein F4778DRAFT_766588, partial [Xylariomycetidae sp. FL2044]